jgi:hypothetical protein
MKNIAMPVTADRIVPTLAKTTDMPMTPVPCPIFWYASFPSLLPSLLLSCFLPSSPFLLPFCSLFFQVRAAASASAASIHAATAAAGK